MQLIRELGGERPDEKFFPPEFFERALHPRLLLELAERNPEAAMAWLPDSLAGQLKGDKDISRKVREALAVEGYVLGTLTRGQVAELLGMTFYEAEEWFVRKGLRRNYGVEDLEEDRKTLDRLLPAS